MLLTNLSVFTRIKISIYLSISRVLHTRQYSDKKQENLDASFKGYSIQSELSAADVLRCISDKKTLSIFKAVALSENDCSSILITKLRLTRKQYYSAFVDYLVGRKSGFYLPSLPPTYQRKNDNNKKIDYTTVMKEELLR
jgi:hypothetical protein